MGECAKINLDEKIHMRVMVEDEDASTGKLGSIFFFFFFFFSWGKSGPELPFRLDLATVVNV